MKVDDKPDQLLAVKRQLKTLRGYKGTARLAGTYRLLIERQLTSDSRMLAVSKAPWIIDVFEKQINPAIKSENIPEDVFDSKAADNAIRALKLFDRFLDVFPNINVINDYVKAITEMGHMTTRRYEKRTLDDRGKENLISVKHKRAGILSIVETALGVMETWELKGLENTMARLQMLEWSIGCASRILLVLDGNCIPDYDENGVRRAHATRNEIVFDYMNRGIFTIEERGGLENYRIVRNLFERLDSELERLIENHPGGVGVLPFIRDLNVRISCSIIEQNPPVPEIIEALIRTGVRGVENLLNIGSMEKLN